MTRLSPTAFDALMVVLSGVIVVGGHLIVWAGLNGLIDGNELFSVWAIPLYAGFVLAAYLLVLWWIGRGRGTDTDHRRAYRAAIVGSAVFVIAVVAELAWRSLRQGGPEGPEGVLAPTRLALFVATILLLSGPILATADRSAHSAREGRVTGRMDVLTLGVALGLLLSLLTLMTGFAHPFVIVAGSAGEEGPTELATDLYLVPIDGSGSRRLTTTPTLWEAHPDVAPDGSRVAFARGVREDFRIFTMASAGGDEVALANGTSHEDGPVWAPTGDRLSFWTAVATPPGAVAGSAEPAPAPGPSAEPRPVKLSGLGIWTIAATGGRAEALSGEGGQGAEAWSPPGDRMCGWTVSAGSFDVAIWDVATGTAAAIATGPSEEWACTWSPDGSRVAFHSDRDGDWEIYSAGIDGSDVRQLTDDPGIDQLPRWSPDGKQIAFISSRGGELEIYVAAADGSSPRDVTNDPALDDGYYGIAWLPDGSGLVAASVGRAQASLMSEATQPLGVGAILLQTLILVCGLLLALRLAPGAVGVATIMGLVNGLLAAFVAGEPMFFAAPLAAGVLVDVLARQWRARSATALTIGVAAAAAVAFTSVYFVVLAATRGIGWSSDLVIGSVVVAALLSAGAAIVLASPTRAAAPVTIE